MNSETVAAEDLEAEVARLRRRLERERRSRVEAETIAERGLRDLYEKQQQLQLLEAIAAEANRTVLLEDVLRFAVLRICRFTDWPLGHVYLVDKNRNPPILVSPGIWSSGEKQRYEPFCRATEGFEMNTAVGLPGRVMASGEPAWITDVVVDDNFPRATVAKSVGLKAGFAFPVLVGREVVAVLEFFSNRALAPDETLLRIMAQIGTQLGRSVERKRSEDKLLHDATHDPLTGLPNRVLLTHRMNAALQDSKRHIAQNFALLFMDLDRFKVVNDSLGHLAGDDLIVQVAARLSSTLRGGDLLVRHKGGLQEGSRTLARLGGDEFIVLLEGIDGVDDALAVADRIQKTLSQPFRIMNEDIYISASIGIAMSRANYETAEELLQAADLAMYRAKSSGKARSSVYDDSLHDAAMKRLKLETELRNAVNADQFLLHYQPIVSLSTGEAAGFEALLRWQRTPTELVYPGDFVHVLEDTGGILDVGLWAMREACRAIKRWNDMCGMAPPMTMSVNVSAKQFAQPDIVSSIQGIIEESGVAAHMIRLEITESIAMDDAERVVEILVALRAIGVRVSIDDFGTGYSSLSYLHRYPLDLLKIDRSFVAELDRGGGDLNIIQSIMSLARSLGMKVIAEGIETQKQMLLLQSLGCDFGQGYLFARPMAAGSIEELLRTRSLRYRVP